jgi:hypothetical protein
VDVPLTAYIGRLPTLEATIGQKTVRLIFDMAAGKTIRTKIRTRDIIYNGVLSEEYLRQWILSFNLSANEAWATRIQPAQESG